MDTETAFPPIEIQPDTSAEVASTAIAKAAGTEVATDITKVDLGTLIDACYTKANADVKKAAETLKDLVLDLPNQAKVDDAIAMRNRLIKTPIAEVRKITKAVKSSLDQGSKRAGANLDGLVTKFEAADTLTPQIEAAEARIAEEKRIAAEKEAARVQKHRDNLAALARPAERAAEPDMTAERIANGIKIVEGIAIDPTAWQEFADRATEQKAVTLERMRVLHAKAVAAEAEAKRLEEERAEAARVAEAQRVEAARLAAIAADLARQQAELQAERDRIAAEAQAKIDEAARVEREAEAERNRIAAEQQAHAEAAARELADAEARSNAAQNSEAQIPQQVLKAEPATAEATDRGVSVITSPSVGSMGAGQAADAAPVADEVPTLSLGAIKERIAPLSITADGLALLGFEATKVKATWLYRESQWDAIKAAMREVLA
jgi:hypothetical protein